MMGLRFIGDVPFRDVYIHALVRDAEGQKMSKSKGNVIDPLHVMEQYGTDALRFTLASMASPGRDIKLAEERIEGYRNFANKIWNAARFILMNLEGPRTVIPPSDRSFPDRWILVASTRPSRWSHGTGSLSVRSRREYAVPIHLARVLRLVPRTDQAHTPKLLRARKDRDQTDSRRDARDHHATPSSVHALYLRRDLANNPAPGREHRGSALSNTRRYMGRTRNGPTFALLEQTIGLVRASACS